MYWFKFPSQLPCVIPKGEGEEGMGGTSVSGGAPKRTTSWEELPKGRIGKMLVYKSGAVKFKMGDVLFDVSQFNDHTHETYFYILKLLLKFTKVRDISYGTCLKFNS